MSWKKTEHDYYMVMFKMVNKLFPFGKPRTFTLMKSNVKERNADKRQYEHDTPTNLVLRT